MWAFGFCRDFTQSRKFLRVHVERIVLFDAAARVDVDLHSTGGSASPPPPAPPPPPPVRRDHRRRRPAHAGRPARSPRRPHRACTPPAVGGGGPTLLARSAARPAARAQPCRLTCSEPRLPMKKTPQFSMSRFGRVRPRRWRRSSTKLSYSHEIENVSGTISGSASARRGTRRWPPS